MGTVSDIVWNIRKEDVEQMNLDEMMRLAQLIVGEMERQFGQRLNVSLTDGTVLCVEINTVTSASREKEAEE